MPRFAANLSMLFTEVPFLDRFERAASAGFEAVEFQFPYAHTAQEIRQRLDATGLKAVLHNLPAGDWDAGERGIACDPRRVQEFRAGVAQAVAYAQALGVPQLLAVQLVRDASGWYTGEIDGIPTMREGKVRRMEQWLAERQLSWADVESTFYSDSMNDVPLLEKVNHPVATNPDPRLRALAQERGWRILDLFSAPSAEPASQTAS